MDKVYDKHPSLNGRKEDCVKQVQIQPEGTTEKPLIADEHPWKPWQHSRSRIKGCLLRVRVAMLSLAGPEWYCYAALGILTALMSFLMDLTVAKMLRAHHWLYSCLEGDLLLQFLCWTLYPASLCALSSSFSHSVCPYSAGSGLPEVRTIISGVELPGYLSLSNLFAKMVGLTCVLASGSTVFLGKVGPFVHLSTMVGEYLNHLRASVSGERERGARGDMLVVAAAVGVASCFGAPISGVLFSIEVMGTHFSVRDYCPCFFAAACGALAFRLLAVLSREHETIQALFKTNFPAELPFNPPEILAYVLLGLLCGAISCFYLHCHRWILSLVRQNKCLNRAITTEKALYSGMVAFLLASVSFPFSAGHFMASQLTTKQLLSSLLDSTQWNSISQNSTWINEAKGALWQAWSPPGTSVYFTLGFFLVMKLWMLVLACTLPLPAGYFMPVFIYGAALGRLLGEGLSYLFPNGNSSKGRSRLINPGGYALVGAAAFSGAVTHTLSPALLALELTGQSTHAMPTLLATLLANALARSRHLPSFYDGISVIKRLPHLPSLLRACPKLASVHIEQFLSPVGALVEVGERAAGVRRALHADVESDEFPVVASHECRTVLGSVSRLELQDFLHHHSDEVSGKRLGEVCIIQPVRMQMSADSTVRQVHCVMSVVGEGCLFVTKERRLVGVITWREMKAIIEKLSEELDMSTT